MGHTDDAVRQSDAPALFGITGDLARKKIFPALYALTKRGKIDNRQPLIIFYLC